MAEAIVQGLVAQEVVIPQNITMKNYSDQERLQELQENYGVSIFESFDAVKEADIIVLATKPQYGGRALSEIAPLLREDTAIVSVMAGVSIKTIEKYAGKRPIARLMPNTSATIGKSSSGAAFNDLVSPELQQQFITLFEAIGSVVVVDDEDLLHAVTALSGSGPAYMYYFIECYEKAGEALGLNKLTARKLMIETMAGAAEMLLETNESPEVLRENVTSPNGTTFAALEELRAHNLEQTIFASATANAERSRELAEENQ